MILNNALTKTMLSQQLAADASTADATAAASGLNVITLSVLSANVGGMAGAYIGWKRNKSYAWSFLWALLLGTGAGVSMAVLTGSLFAAKHGT